MSGLFTIGATSSFTPVVSGAIPANATSVTVLIAQFGLVSQQSSAVQVNAALAPNGSCIVLGEWCGS
jgi:hypothetical protein